MRGERVWSEINLNAIHQNLRALRNFLSPGTDILAVVKADAYGHGALPISRAAQEFGCAMLGVGDSTEALELRDAGITGPILILGAILEEEIPRVVQNDIRITVHSTNLLARLNAEACRFQKSIRLHLKIDTGMCRLGVAPESTRSTAQAILEYPALQLEGIATHLATRDPDITRNQLNVFHNSLQELLEMQVYPQFIHAANSFATMNEAEAHYNLVRPGLAMYGIDKSLTPVLSLHTRIAFLKTIPADSGVGYDHRFITRRPTRIATCPVGYNDGYPHALSNRGNALLHGQRVPVVGTITMDYLMLDVTDLESVHVGDEVTLIGKSGADEIRIEELATRCNTIPYAISCGLGKRVKRVYVRNEVSLPNRTVA